MGKKDKNKKKVSGTVKTALKTEKKLKAKQKKELEELGEDDIEKVVAQIEREEARRQRVVEATVDQPSRRVNFSLTAHPFKDELILLGGQFHDGRKTVVYGDMFTYNLTKKEWTVIKAPGAPPPRCGHQAIATATNKGELWVFGGEFPSPTESQFYHYRDLWVYRIAEKKWEKILVSGGPSARSGHKMACIKKQIIIFGGVHDNLREYKYFNDVHIFNLETYKWNKIEPLGIPPQPRSGCIIMQTPENKLLVYGGYSAARIKKDVDKGQVHNDMFILTPDKNDQSGLKWKWVAQKQSGIKFSPRCSSTAIMVQPNLAYMFGGVFDIEDEEEELTGQFYNDLIALDLDKFQWHMATLSGKRSQTARRRRRKLKADDSNSENDSGSESDSQDPPLTSTVSTITDDDGIFTVTVGPTLTSSVSTTEKTSENMFVPSPRINPGLAMKNGVLYLYGGMIERGNRLYTFNDFYSLDCRKMDEWKIIISDDLSTQTWYDSSSSDSDIEENGDSSEDDDTDSDEN